MNALERAIYEVQEALRYRDRYQEPEYQIQELDAALNAALDAMQDALRTLENIQELAS